CDGEDQVRHGTPGPRAPAGLSGTGGAFYQAPLIVRPREPIPVPRARASVEFNDLVMIWTRLDCVNPNRSLPVSRLQRPCYKRSDPARSTFPDDPVFLVIHE
ncbi:hypothetical protein K3G38_19195, partial [Planomicrobium glaciei]|nr:hypothetical protein [Planococcus glaciei]